jgi:serine/threonine protein kinase
MTPERWQRINEMFHAALVLDGRERSAFLVTQSAGDDALRAKVAALLVSHEQAEGFIQGSVFNDAAQLLVEDEAEAMIGQHIGLYEITREIGRGGMGSVYLATRDDDQFQHQVAIKVVRRGMDTDLVLARFRNERQILAGFDHPNIARLFDGGSTETGLPYFIMEYVEGRPLMSIAIVTGSQPPVDSNYFARCAQRSCTRISISWFIEISSPVISW